MSAELRLGPQVIERSGAALRWVAVAPIVKAIDDVGIFAHARSDAQLIFRHYVADQGAMLAQPQAFAAAVLAALGGFRAPGRLTVELLNEIGAADQARYVAFAKVVVPILNAAGVDVGGPSWATGDYSAADWALWRAARWCGFTKIFVHGYWADAGFTTWNALRHRQYWVPTDPDVDLVECGRDFVRDGNAAVNGGMIGGPWTTSGISAETYQGELLSFAQQLLPHESATPFVSGPSSDWQPYSLDSISDALITKLRYSSIPTGGTVLNIGPGLLKAAPYLGPFTDSETYDAAGTDHEVSKVATPKGYANWSKATNETVVYVNDGRIYADLGNHGDGSLKAVRGPFR